MLYHTVLFRFVDGTTQEAIDDNLDHLRGMAAVPVVRSLAAGPNVLPFGPGEWSHGMTLVFDSTQAMVEEFFPHPLHLDVVRDQLPLWERYIAVDVESDATTVS